MPGAWLVLPTFNEAENIEPIIRAALPHLASTGLAHTILVVDDNSPDGTGSIADLLLEMDSDFSHDPADLSRLIAAAEDADLVLGSRYVPGGGVTDWGMGRRLISRGGSLYAKLLLGIPVNDLTGGFKCFRREVLERLDLSGVGTDGYGFQIEMTFRTIRAGFRVKEIPITFRDRRVGSSKMSARIAIEAFWKVPALRLRRYTF